MKRLSMAAPVRVHPFTGLVVDVDTWATAHEYHRRQQQLHLVTLHGSGVAHGLEVLPTDPPSDTVVIEPGIAVDDSGNMIVVPARQRVGLGGESDLAYIVVDYVESLPPASANGSNESRGRVVEDFRIRTQATLPESPALELARINLRPGEGSVVVSPANPWTPAVNEIDCRFRFHSSPHGLREISVGLMICGDESQLAPGHMLGFQFFLRELTHCGLRPYLVASDSGRVPASDIIYVTGSGEVAVPDDAVKEIRDRLKQGSWLFADACGTGVEMVQSLMPIAKGQAKESQKTEDQVLGAHFVFGAAPPGASSTKELLWGPNCLISPRDYGCAWSGRRGDQALQRDQIRSALEFAVNVGICASRTTLAS